MSFQDFGKSTSSRNSRRPAVAPSSSDHNHTTTTTKSRLNPVAESSLSSPYNLGSSSSFGGASSSSTSYSSSGGAGGNRSGIRSAPSSGGGGGGGGATLDIGTRYTILSDSILQYQRNVGILQNIARSVGTKADGPTLETQFQVQVDVIKQLGERIETQLSSLETNLSSLSSNRTETSRVRATHIKLTRDYRTVESTFKKVAFEVRQLRTSQDVRRRQEEMTAAKMEEQRRKDVEIRQQQRLHMLQEEEEVNLQIMREREEEIRNINKGMHTVNEIYKDLANIVGEQQDNVDRVEKHMEQSNVHAKTGLEQLEKANASNGQCIIS